MNDWAKRPWPNLTNFPLQIQEKSKSGRGQPNVRPRPLFMKVFMASVDGLEPSEVYSHQGLTICQTGFVPISGPYQLL